MRREKKKFIPKNEFRYNNNTKHPNYIFGESGGKYRSLGITHSDQTFGKKNMPIKFNPKKNEHTPAFVRNGIVSDKKQNYSSKPIKNMSFERSDFANVKSKIRNYKKRHKKTSSKRR